MAERTPADVTRGVVDAFDERVGLGAIATDDGERFPFHCIELVDGTRTIEVGTAVAFDVRHKLGRREAARIRAAEHPRS